MAQTGGAGGWPRGRRGLGAGGLVLAALVGIAMVSAWILRPRPDPRPPVLRHPAGAGGPARLIPDSALPREPVSLLFFEGRPTVPGPGRRRTVVTDAGMILISDSALRIQSVALPLDGAMALAAAPIGGGAWWVSTLDGGLLRADPGRGRTVHRAAPFRASSLWPDPRSEGVLVSRSPERFGFAPEERGTPVVVSITDEGGLGEARGTQVVPAHALLTTLANSGYLAAAGDTVYFAPVSRPEIVALGPGGDTIWTSSAADLPPAPEPRFRLVGGRAHIDYQPVNLALTLGPDGNLYVLRAADTAVRRTRLDVIDRANGHVLRSASFDTARVTLAANHLGRVYVLPADRLLRAVPRGRRESFPPFQLPRLGGGSVSLREMSGRVTLINVWASWCSPCRTEMPALDTLRRELASERFRFLALNEDEDRGAAERFVTEHGLEFPVLFGDGALKRKLHYPGLPYTVLLDQGGRIVRRWYGELGPADYATIRLLVRSEVLAGDPGAMPAPASGSATPHHHHDEP